MWHKKDKQSSNLSNIGVNNNLEAMMRVIHSFKKLLFITCNMSSANITNERKPHQIPLIMILIIGLRNFFFRKMSFRTEFLILKSQSYNENFSSVYGRTWSITKQKQEMSVSPRNVPPSSLISGLVMGKLQCAKIHNMSQFQAKVFKIQTDCCGFVKNFFKRRTTTHFFSQRLWRQASNVHQETVYVKAARSTLKLKKQINRTLYNCTGSISKGLYCFSEQK